MTMPLLGFSRGPVLLHEMIKMASSIVYYSIGREQVSGGSFVSPK